MAGPKINEKLGLKPVTRRRPMMRDAGKDAAAAIKTSRTCPECGAGWVLDNVIRGRRRLMCSRCSYGWNWTPADDAWPPEGAR
jgi:ribosomal protein S27AE